MMRGVAGLVLLVLVSVGGLRTGAAQEPVGPVALFNGTSLDGWIVENSTGENFSVQGGVLRVEGPNGWLRSAKSYGDFTLRVEFRCVTEDADSGVFVRAPGPASNIFLRGWPANAYQVQLREMSRNRSTNPIWIGNLYRHRVAAGVTEFDGPTALGAAKPMGEWQTVLIDVRGQHLSVTLNGAPVTRAEGIANPSGYIGLQGEAGVVEYRSMALTEGPAPAGGD
jgi:Domain of Unknown Function (DUF1080)